MYGPRLSLLGGPIALQCFVHISDKKLLVFNDFDRGSHICIYIYMRVFLYNIYHTDTQYHNDANMYHQKNTSCFRFHFLDVVVTKKFLLRGFSMAPSGISPWPLGAPPVPTGHHRSCMNSSLGLDCVDVGIPSVTTESMMRRSSFTAFFRPLMVFLYEKNTEKIEKRHLPSGYIYD